jgi:alkanesulfonate monooxygenase SsuD/methylene tetrahydromethanopterin reductase-like flavin-dependent oxidoreductase (luciferase family)
MFTAQQANAMSQADDRLQERRHGTDSQANLLKLYTDFPSGDFELLPRVVNRIEETGYTGIFSTENKHDPLLPIAAVARRDLGLELGTGVIALLARSPFVVAQSSWDLQYNTGERFVLGVGTQSDEHLRGRYGIQHQSKHERLAESILAIRELWASWMNDRQPYFIGSYYLIDSCPDAFRPTTRLARVPKIFVLCSTKSDLEVASRVADGIFTHPMWSTEYIDSIVWPYLVSHGADRKLEIIAGSIIATGESKLEWELARKHAQQRLEQYLCSVSYDYVFDSLGISELIFEFRKAKGLGYDLWKSDAGAQLYTMFSCDASLDDLPGALAEHINVNVSGIFPNVMSRIRRILPREHVSRIVSCRLG